LGVIGFGFNGQAAISWLRMSLPKDSVVEHCNGRERVRLHLAWCSFEITNGTQLFRAVTIENVERRAA